MVGVDRELHKSLTESSGTPSRPTSFLRTDGLLSAADFRFASIVSAVFVAISTTLVFSRSNNYMELADQSLYLLMIDNPRASIRSASAYHVLLSPLFSAVDESIIRFRMLRALLDIGADVLLGFSLVHYLRARHPSGLFTTTASALTVIFSIILAGFAAWIYAVNGFGYDQLGGIILTLLVAALLVIIAREGTSNGAPFLAIAGGALLSLALIVRWTAAVAATALLLWTLFEHCGFRRTVALIRYGAGGALGALIAVHTLLIDLPTLFGGIRSGTVDVSRDTHSPGVLLLEYVRSLVVGVSGGIGVLIAVVFALALIRSRRRIRGAIPIAAVGSGLMLYAIQSLFGLQHFVEANTAGTYLALASGALLLHQLRGGKHTHRVSAAVRDLALPITLVALPVLLAAGTFLPLFLTALPLASTWVAALWTLVPNSRSQALRAIGILVGGAILSTMPWLLWQSLERPARTVHTNESVLVERGRFAGLHVDQATQTLFHDLEDLRVELAPNPTVISLWVRPAVPFALEGTALGFPWYNVKAPNAAAKTISGACIEDGDTPTGEVVFVTQERDPQRFGPLREALRECGIDFPNNFELVTTMTAPEGVPLFVYVREAG